MISLMQWPEVGVVGPLTKDGTRLSEPCAPGGIAFLAGTGVTDSAGGWKLDASQELCEPLGDVYAVSFVATAAFDPLANETAAGFFVQTGYAGLGAGPLLLYVRSWGCDCKRRPYTRFDYHVAIAHHGH